MLEYEVERDEIELTAPGFERRLIGDDGHAELLRETRGVRAIGLVADRVPSALDHLREVPAVSAAEVEHRPPVTAQQVVGVSDRHTAQKMIESRVAAVNPITFVVVAEIPRYVLDLDQRAHF